MLKAIIAAALALSAAGPAAAYEPTAQERVQWQEACGSVFIQRLEQFAVEHQLKGTSCVEKLEAERKAEWDRAIKLVSCVSVETCPQRSTGSLNSVYVRSHFRGGRLVGSYMRSR